MLSRPYSTLIGLALAIAAIGSTQVADAHARSDLIIPESVELECSTCESGFSSHKFLNNCCVPSSEGCANCPGYACHLDPQPNVCGVAGHTDCGES